MIKMNNKYLLMIEPDREGKPSLEPVKDELTEKTAYILSKIEKSRYNYKGFHITQCGKTSDIYDWILPNGKSDVAMSFCEPRSCIGRLSS